MTVPRETVTVGEEEPEQDDDMFEEKMNDSDLYLPEKLIRQPTVFSKF